MASAVVRIKTAVESNGLVQANEQAAKLSKSLKKIATAGWIGVAVGVAKKAADALKDCTKAYLQADGAGSEFAKGMDNLSKSTDRLKKAIGGSILAGSSGNTLNGLSNMLEKVARAIENDTRKKNITAQARSSSYGQNKSADELWKDYIAALQNRMDIQNQIMMEGGVDTASNQLIEALNDASRIVEKVGTMYAQATERLMTTEVYKGGAVTSSATTKADYLALFGESRLLSEADQLQNNETQKKAYETLLNSARDSAAATEYLMKTNSLFADFALKRNQYKSIADNAKGTEMGAAAEELRSQFQTALNIMAANLLDGLPAKIEEAVSVGVDNSALLEWEQRQNEEGRKRREQLEALQEKINGIKESLYSSLGSFGTALKGDWWSLLAEFIGKAVQRLNEISPNFNKIINFLDVIVSAFDPIFQLVDVILGPFIEVFKNLYGVIYLISSIIKALGTTVISGFKWVVAAITFDKKGRTAAQNDIATAWASVSEAGIKSAIAKAFSSSYGGSSSSSGGSASYTAARDIYVAINYNNSYVNGDARQIAINLRNEIRTAEAMGY